MLTWFNSPLSWQYTNPRKKKGEKKVTNFCQIHEQNLLSSKYQRWYLGWGDERSTELGTRKRQQRKAPSPAPQSVCTEMSLVLGLPFQNMKIKKGKDVCLDNYCSQRYLQIGISPAWVVQTPATLQKWISPLIYLSKTPVSRKLYEKKWQCYCSHSLEQN